MSQTNQNIINNNNNNNNLETILNNTELMQYNASRSQHWAFGGKDINERITEIEMGIWEVDKLSTWKDVIYWVVNKNTEFTSSRRYGYQYNHNRKYLYKIFHCAMIYAPLPIFAYIINSSNIKNHQLNSIITSKIPIDKLCFLISHHNLNIFHKCLVRQFNFDQVVEMYDRLIINDFSRALFKRLYLLLTKEEQSIIFNHNHDQNHDILYDLEQEVVKKSSIYNNLLIHIPVKDLIILIILPYLY